MSKALVLVGTDFSANKLTTVTLEGGGGGVSCTGIALDHNTLDVFSLTAVTLTATVSPSNCTDPVTWASSDSTIATVSNGVVTPLKIGTATITATCGNYSASCVLTVSGKYESDLTFGMLFTQSDAVTAEIPDYSHIAMADHIAYQAPRKYIGRTNSFSDYRLAPHLFPSGTKRIQIKAKNLASDYSMYLFFMNSTTASDYSANYAKRIDTISQDGTTIDYTAVVPEGADSFACHISTNVTYTSSDDPGTAAQTHEFEAIFLGS